MNAREAREKATAFNTDKENSQYAKIKALIEGAADTGEYGIYFHESIKIDVAAKLLNEGFSMGTPTEFRDEYSIKISW